MVLAHPSPTSFTGQLVDRFSEGARGAGHSVEVADLYAENFDPLLRQADLVQFSGGRMPDDVLGNSRARTEQPLWCWPFRSTGGPFPRGSRAG